jgi:hypothetical protein
MNFLPKLLQGLSFLPAVINSIESLFANRSGQEKKESAISFITAAMQISEAVSNRDIVDEPKFREGLSKIVDGAVDCFNSSSWSHTK